MRKLVVIVILLAVVGGAGVAWRRTHAAPEGARFRTAAVQRGDLLVAISATGTVEPVEVIDVGAQVAGQVLNFGVDPRSGGPIDYGSEIEANAVLAEIDSSLYAADVAGARAQLDQDKANLQRAAADLLQLKAKLVQAEANWKRAQELGPSRALSASDYDSYLATFETARANVAVGEATIAQARAGIGHDEAVLQRAQRNLSYCTITSPVNGVIIDRRVNIGQTVVASLNAPSLFLIAKDLRRMQVWAAVNEADIGRIYAGQPVTFTCDAYPGESFVGQVGKIRLNASMTQNVVTYTVEVNTDNSSGRLLPYLTANVQFEVARRSDVLLVPNAALNWTPPADALVAGADGEKPGGARRGADGRGGAAARPASAAAAQASSRPSEIRLWIPAGDKVRPLRVTAGATDGAFTEISGPDVAPGLELAIGEARAAAGAGGVTNPFTPQMFGGGGRRS